MIRLRSLTWDRLPSNGRSGMKALGYLKRSLSRSAPTDSITRKLFALIARAHQMRGDFPAALSVCTEGLSFEPEDAELWFRKAVVHRHAGQPADAEESWRRILTLSRPKKFASVDQGIYGHLTRRNLAALARRARGFGGGAAPVAPVLEECPGDLEALKHTQGVAPGRLVGAPSGREAE